MALYWADNSSHGGVEIGEQSEVAHETYASYACVCICLLRGHQDSTGSLAEDRYLNRSLAEVPPAARAGDALSHGSTTYSEGPTAPVLYGVLSQ